MKTVDAFIQDWIESKPSSFVSVTEFDEFLSSLGADSWNKKILSYYQYKRQEEHGGGHEDDREESKDHSLSEKKDKIGVKIDGIVQRTGTGTYVDKYKLKSIRKSNSESKLEGKTKSKNKYKNKSDTENEIKDDDNNSFESNNINSNKNKHNIVITDGENIIDAKTKQLEMKHNPKNETEQSVCIKPHQQPEQTELERIQIKLDKINAQIQVVKDLKKLEDE